MSKRDGATWTSFDEDYVLGLGDDPDLDLDADRDELTIDLGPSDSVLVAEQSGPIPPEVPWSEMVHYICQKYGCQNPCINHVDEGCTQARLCRACYEFDKLEL